MKARPCPALVLREALWVLPRANSADCSVVSEPLKLGLRHLSSDRLGEPPGESLPMQGPCGLRLLWAASRPWH